MFAWRACVFVLVATAVVPCRALESSAPPANVATVVARTDGLALALEGELKSAQATNKGDEADLSGARAYYAAHGFAPIWVGDRGFAERGKLALAELGRANAWGLDAAVFAQPVLQIDARAPATNALAKAEVGLTRAVLKYARFARGGRIAAPGSDLSGYLDRGPQLLAANDVLDAVAAGMAVDATLRGFHPQHPQFEKLRLAYVAARQAEAAAIALKLPSGPALVAGVSHPSVALLRQRLSVPVNVALAPAPDAATVYNPELVAAVKAFQVKAGLGQADGIVGEKTRAALNAGSGVSSEILLANMEQWRWMPADLGTSYVQVNIPDYEMQLVSGGRVVHRERVVVGRVDTATPIFSADMQTIVFQPKWGVPDSIKVNELLPRLQQGRGLRPGLQMSLDGVEVDAGDIDWSRADITRYHVFQPSGDDNALGVVKFLFPNRHSVYLHDTPSKGLFNTRTRAYSHGCVRVRNPIALAQLILAADKSWDKAKVVDLVEDGPEDNPVKLTAKVPVHITYFTASVDEAGNVTTSRDVYGHERRITLALAGRMREIVKLDPQPVVAQVAPRLQRVVVADTDGLQVRRGGEGGRFVSPYGLTRQEAYVAPAIAAAPAPRARGYRGNTTNDIIMRSLGGGF